MSSPLRVRVIGLGIMGGPFARKILQDGFIVCDHDIDTTNVETFRQLGGIPADSANDGAAKVMWSSLP